MVNLMAKEISHEEKWKLIAKKLPLSTLKFMEMFMVPFSNDFRNALSNLPEVNVHHELLEMPI
jgi:hypothetical protein